jgi:DNA-binding response OmpR family regulator
MVADALALGKRATPLKIILVDDEDWFLEIVEKAILDKVEGVTVQTFQDSNKAWQELLRTIPDILIVGGVIPELGGEEIVRRLVDICS